MGAILQIFFDLSRPAADCLIKLFPTKNFLHLSSIQPHPKLPKIINIQSNTNPTLNPTFSLYHINIYLYAQRYNQRYKPISYSLIYQIIYQKSSVFPESYSKSQFNLTYLHYNQYINLISFYFKPNKYPLILSCPKYLIYNTNLILS